MRLKGLKSILLVSLLSSSLFAGFNVMNPLQSSSHTSNTASKNEQVTLTWNQAITNNSDTLAGYYYILDQSENTLIPTVVNTRSTLGTSATSITVTAPNEGTFHFHLAPYANSGNIGATLHFKFIKVDTSAPVGLSISPNGGSFNSVQTISMSATDDNSFTIYYTRNNSNPTQNSVAYTTPFRLSSSQTVKSIAIDSAGNSSPITSASFTINNASYIAQFANEVTAESTIATNNTGGSSSFIPSLSIEGSSIVTYRFKIDTSSYSAQMAKSLPIDISGLQDGRHTISIVGFDGTDSQLESEATELSFIVDNTAPENVTFSIPSTTSITSNTTVTMSSRNSDDIYYILDGSIPDKTSTKSSTVTISSINNGTFTLRAISYDSVENKSTVQEEIYTVNVLPSSSSSSTNSDSSPNPTNSDSSPNPTNSDSSPNPTNSLGTFPITLPFEFNDGRESVNINSDIPNSTATTNTDGTVTVLASTNTIKHELQVNTDGTLNSTTIIGSVESKIEINTIGADTKLNSDGSLKITSSILNEEKSSIISNVEISSNGEVLNSLNITVKDGTSTLTIVKSNILGTDTIVADDGAMTLTTPTITTKNNQVVEFEILLNTSGEAIPSLIIDGIDIPLPQFEVGSTISIEKELDKILLKIETLMTEPVTFN